ncbi:unnamed protein product [Arctia plantaginis]|uniref:Uncharacterized protein n=1 Tax=Arctia plantaginis TaxID=874455 RepID=A0A8S1B7F1_ARCPL|nr:unnamed protein product [Arctia plantaginis]
MRLLVVLKWHAANSDVAFVISLATVAQLCLHPHVFGDRVAHLISIDYDPLESQKPTREILPKRREGLWAKAPGAVAAGAGLRPRPSPTTSISSSESSASSAAGGRLPLLGHEAARHGRRPHRPQRGRISERQDEQRKREKKRKSGAPGERLASDRARPLAVVVTWCGGRYLYRARGVCARRYFDRWGDGWLRTTPYKLCKSRQL